jgi:hypothetical protein
VMVEGAAIESVEHSALRAVLRGVTTVAKPWFKRGTSNLARRCDPSRAGSGSRPRLEDERPVRTTLSRAWSWELGTLVNHPRARLTLANRRKRDRLLRRSVVRAQRQLPPADVMPCAALVAN